MRHLVVYAMLTGLILLQGCTPPPPVDPQPPAPILAPPSQEVQAEGGPVMAIVNGEAIYMKQLHEALIRGQGVGMGQQLIVTAIVKQEAAKRNATIDDKDLEFEHQRMLADTFSSVDEPQQRERLLAQFLQEKQMPRLTWDMAVERNALLRKMVLPDLKVSDEMLQAELTETYGRRVQVRHIEVESLNEAQRMLDMLRDGADFVELAQKHSKNPSAANGGILPPISAASDIPPALRQVALAMVRPGELSAPVKLGYAFHILRLEKVVPAKDVALEDVRESLDAAVRQKIATGAQQRLLIELMRNASYEYVDPLMKELDAADRNKLR